MAEILTVLSFGGWGVVGGFRCITEFKPKPYLALAGIWLGWGCDNILCPKFLKHSRYFWDTEQKEKIKIV